MATRSAVFIMAVTIGAQDGQLICGTDNLTRSEAWSVQRRLPVRPPRSHPNTEGDALVRLVAPDSAYIGMHASPRHLPHRPCAAV